MEQFGVYVIERSQWGYSESIWVPFAILQPQRLRERTSARFTTAKLNDRHVRLSGFN
jgi:hypothetical protein